MNRMATAALMLSLGVGYVHAQERRLVNLTFSGTSEASTVNLQPGTSTGEENFAGNGTLGPFTYRELQAGSAAPQPSSTCSGPTQLYFPIVSGAGVFRFRNGSLLMVRITDGATCADLTVREGHVTVTYQITGGSGTFKGASGTLAFTAATFPVLFTSTNDPIFFAVTGEFTGTVAF